MSSILYKISQNKKVALVLSILMDLLGLVSFTLPYFGEFSDVIWAPISAYLMSKLYPNRSGKIASVIVFLEEILPFTDVIPSFTFMWIYKHIIKK